MIEARADAVVPATVSEAFAVATDLDRADWVPAVRALRRVSGSPDGVGARYTVEVGLVGRHLSGVLVCAEMDAPRRARYVLEDGLDLSMTFTVKEVPGGSNLELVAAYAVRGPFAGAVERASAGAARREVARAVEQLAARFGRKEPPPAASASRRGARRRQG